MIVATVFEIILWIELDLVEPEHCFSILMDLLDFKNCVEGNVFNGDWDILRPLLQQVHLLLSNKVREFLEIITKLHKYYVRSLQVFFKLQGPILKLLV